MLLRIRTKDGMERVTVTEGATVGQLKSALEAGLGVPAAQQTLSLEQKVLLEGADLSAFRDMADDRASLNSLNVRHGSVVFCAHGTERKVAATVKPNSFRKMTMDDLFAKQTRIERQEAPACATLSLDRDAANAFQSYGHQTGFNAMRMGLLYGTVDEQGNVRAEVIFEPPQDGNHVVVERAQGSEAAQEKADALASSLGMRRVGLIFSRVLHEEEAEFTVSAAEMRLMAAEAAPEGMDESFVSVAVKPELNEEGRAEVHFEAFQASKQCVDIYKKGLFANTEAYDGVEEIRKEEGEDVDLSEVLDVGSTRMTKDVVVAGRDVKDVDNDFFLVPVKILDHAGPLGASFPVENRLIPQTVNELRAHLQGGKSKGLPYVQILSDFHLLLFLAKHMDGGDIALLADAVRAGNPVAEGYQLIIEALAGLA